MTAPNQSGRVAGKTALITGAAQGLGEAIARMLVREGARVVLTDINGPKVREVADSLGAVALALEHDVTQELQWQEVLSQAVSHFGGLHILVNNAGIASLGSVEDLSLEEWRRVHAVDLDSVFLGCKYAISHLRKSGGGAVVNIASISGLVAAPNTAAYNSAKAAVRHLTRSVALHCARERTGIRCNAILPVFIDTPILDTFQGDQSREELLAKLARQIPLGTVGKPEDVAHAVLYLASEESRLMTGSELVLDGGLSAM